MLTIIISMSSKRTGADAQAQRHGRRCENTDGRATRASIGPRRIAVMRTPEKVTSSSSRSGAADSRMFEARKFEVRVSSPRTIAHFSLNRPFNDSKSRDDRHNCPGWSFGN